MKDNSFYIPVEMEALPEIKNKIDFYVEEKFDFAHAEKPEEDATLTIKKNDVTIANFRASDKFDTVANIIVPTKTSDLLNDSDFITNADVPTQTSQLTNDSNFVSDAHYVHTEENFTTVEKTKLNGLHKLTILINSIAYDVTYFVKTTMQGIDGIAIYYDDGSPDGSAVFIPDADGFTTFYQMIQQTYATKSEVPDNTSDLVNDSGYITANDAPVKSVDGKTGEVIVDKVVRVKESSDSTYMLDVESVNQSESNFKSYMVGGTKTLCYANNKIYEDIHFEQEASFPNTVAIYMLDYIEWAVQLINFSDVVTSQEIKLYKLCKLNLSEISQEVYFSTIDSIEFTASDGSTLIWHSNGEIETL